MSAIFLLIARKSGASLFIRHIPTLKLRRTGKNQRYESMEKRIPGAAGATLHAGCFPVPLDHPNDLFAALRT